MSQPTSTKVCFSMSGEWFADFARTRLEEGAWDRALNLLVETMQGMTHDQAIAILKGEATLVGDSSDEKGIRFKKLRAGGKLEKATAERLDYMYGDLFRYGDTVYRPYALVSGWDKDDYDYAGKGHVTKYLDLSGGGCDHHSAARSLYYANSKKDLLVVITPRWFDDNTFTGDVLCEEVNATIPFWYKLDTNKPLESINKILSKRTLPIFGADGSGPLTSSTKIDPEEIKQAKIKEADEGGLKLLMETLVAIEEFINEGNGQQPLSEIREWNKVFRQVIETCTRSLNDETVFERIENAEGDLKRMLERGMQRAVNEQAEANGGFIELPLFKDYNDVPYEPKTLRVPKNPFYLWALRFIDFAACGHPEITWEKVAGSGWKMYNDDPYHTDWMLGAGVPLDDTYKHIDDSFADVVMKSAYRYRDVVNKEITGHSFTVLTKNKDITSFYGEIVMPQPNERVKPGSIAVVPHAGPEYQMAMETACMESAEDERRGLIICETGGKLAHLVIVGREFKCTVLMIPNAMTMYREGQRVSIDMEAGTILTHLL